MTDMSLYVIYIASWRIFQDFNGYLSRLLGAKFLITEDHILSYLKGCFVKSDLY